jgi:tyrosine-protein phosphatase SIW14
MRFPPRKLALLLFVTVSLTVVPKSATHSLKASDAGPVFAEKISIPGVHNAGKVTEHLYRGAQPILGQLPKLKKLGVTTVIDLRAEFPNAAEEERLHVEALGMRFIRMPIDGFSIPKTSDLATFFRLLGESPPQTIFLHCQYGRDRTGVMIAAYRIAVENWTPAQALSEMQKFGFNRFWHPAMETFIRTLPTRLETDLELKRAIDPT